ncbi:hypothetical protein DMB44_06625 [Thermoplasma sp. Kam2015]|uniref:hypothetical protein n=1 Tax=Thermoplasma sp. Kam2015 TaxID=2094122 RepID=UPI000D8B477E|nr:hypothetical protein [Thermoplasma sp. Kam2015]PYB67959.1 hypothetical protein DMB44_06625 [Thermoplasma sp. Kam2015]
MFVDNPYIKPIDRESVAKRLKYAKFKTKAYDIEYIDYDTICDRLAESSHPNRDYLRTKKKYEPYLFADFVKVSYGDDEPIYIQIDKYNILMVDETT